MQKETINLNLSTRCTFYLTSIKRCSSSDSRASSHMSYARLMFSGLLESRGILVICTVCE